MKCPHCGGQIDSLATRGMVFPVIGQQTDWAVSADQLQEWGRVYATLDVTQELRKAQAWIVANPTRRKTARGMPRFLVQWLNRATDRRSSPPQQQQSVMARATARFLQGGTT